MSIVDGSFVLVDEKYFSGVAIDEYDGKFKIVEARRSKDGDVFVKWGYPQKSDRTPSAKAIPWGNELGTLEDAITNIKKILAALLRTENAGAERTQRTEAPPPDDDIPF